MKNYISLGVMLTLLDGKTHTAKELSEKFETSVKTIYRSIDMLLAASMPIVSLNGRNGGYKIISSSLINSGFFTTDELCSFLSFTEANKDKLLCNVDCSISDRISGNLNETEARTIIDMCQKVIIDTDVWGKISDAKSYSDIIKDAINNENKICIYYKESQTQKRVIHPYCLVYKVGSWYVYAYCEKRLDFRLFKLSRITELHVLDSKFVRQNINLLSKPWNKSFKESNEKIKAKIFVNNKVKNDVIEWLGANAKKISETDDGMVVEALLINSRGLIHKIMELGNLVTVLAPTSLITELKSECQNIFNNYSKLFA